jgi:hypothetical protein
MQTRRQLEVRGRGRVGRVAAQRQPARVKLDGLLGDRVARVGRVRTAELNETARGRLVGRRARGAKGKRGTLRTDKKKGENMLTKSRQMSRFENGSDWSRFPRRK